MHKHANVETASSPICFCFHARTHISVQFVFISVTFLFVAFNVVFFFLFFSSANELFKNKNGLFDRFESRVCWWSRQFSARMFFVGKKTTRLVLLSTTTTTNENECQRVTAQLRVLPSWSCRGCVPPQAIGRQRRGVLCDRHRHSALRKSGPSACTPPAAGRRERSERSGRSSDNRNTEEKKTHTILFLSIPIQAVRHRRHFEWSHFSNQIKI